MRNFIFIITAIFTLYSCGYEPQLANKKINFGFESYELYGDEKISKKILNRIIQLNDSESSNKIFIDTKLQRSVGSKNEKGDPDTFNMTIFVKLTINNGNTDKILNFKETVSYNNLDSKFELKQYESKIEENLSKKVSKDIFSYLAGL